MIAYGAGLLALATITFAIACAQIGAVNVGYGVGFLPGQSRSRRSGCVWLVVSATAFAAFMFR